MAEKENPFSRIKIEYRRSSPLTKIVAVAAILLSMMALITLRLAQNDIDAQTTGMKAEASQLEQDNAELERKIDQLGSVQSVEEIAQEELGLVDPDTVIIDTE